MSEKTLKLQVSDQAQIAVSSLGAEDRRLVHAWFDHLRHWHIDEFIRAHSIPLSSDDNSFAFETSTDLVIAFSILEDAVVILAIFRKDALRAFREKLERASV